MVFLMTIRKKLEYIWAERGAGIYNTRAIPCLRGVFVSEHS